MPVPKDFSHQNLQSASFREKDLSYASFLDSDLRGADFSGADLTGANFTNVKTGITPMNKVWIFLIALIISVLSGYVSMLAGHTIGEMLKSNDNNIRNAGIATSILILLFLGFAYWKGGKHAVRNLILPAVIVAIIIAVVAKISGFGTGQGMVYLVLALALTVLMLLVGTISRAAAGSLSNILFIVVALAGGLFAKNLGGGIGTLIMAVSCALISKRALSGVQGFEGLRKVALFLTSKFGTSFRNAKLAEANFSKSEIHNSDFTNVDISKIKWGDSKKMNCIINENWFQKDGRKK